MAFSAFSFFQYRPYLKAALSTGPRKGRGRRSELARALGCHSGYISRVLRGDADLSVEQALRASTYFGQTPEESSYFLLLVQHDRAGTPELKAHFEIQLEEARRRHLDLRHRLGQTKKLQEPDQATYYSSWHYSAVHVATSAPALGSIEAISAYLKLSPQKVAQTLEFLVAAGLVVEQKRGFSVGQTHLHVDPRSISFRQHHVQWRLKSIISLDSEAPTDLHYSSVICCSREDVLRLKQLLVDAIEKARHLVKSSGNEVVYCYALDLFEVGSSKPA